MRQFVVAIDGPAGSGKSTLARRLAEVLGLPYLNTGQMYRFLALEAIRRGIAPDDGSGLAALARTLTFEVDGRQRPPSLAVEGAPPARELLAPEVETSVSLVSSHREVRAVMRAAQRRLGSGGGVIEGRDIGTVVFPDASVKVFLEAAATERVARRVEERGEPTARPDEVATSLSARDALDERTNPFVPAADAVAIDTTGIGTDEVFERVLALVLERLGEGLE